MPNQSTQPGLWRLFQSTRAPTLIATVTAVLLCVPPQLADMLQAVDDDPWFSVRYQMALALIAFLAWFWARTALNACIDRADDEPRQTALPWRKEGPGTEDYWSRRFWWWWPKLLLLLVGLSGCYTAARADAWTQVFFSLSWMAPLLALLSWRRPMPAFPGAGEMPAARRVPPLAIRRYAPWPRSQLALVSIAAGTMVFLLAAFDTMSGLSAIRIADRIAQAFPGPAAALICLALIIGPLSFAFTQFDVHWPHFSSELKLLPDIPLAPVVKPMTALAILAVGLTYWSSTLNLHPVRTITVDSARDAAGPKDRVVLADALKSWVERCGGRDPKAAIRPVVVAISGGASRAGLWGTRVLRAVDSLSPAAGGGIFAISSVSGGSLAAADYVTRRAGAPSGHCRLSDWMDAQDHSLSFPLPDDDKAIAEYGSDLLGPLLANLLLNDVARALLAGPAHLVASNLPAASGDRADALERAFERAFPAPPFHAAAPSLASPTLSLFYDRQAEGQEQSRWVWKPGMPVWISNGTDVQGGERLLTIPVRAKPAKQKDYVEDSLDLLSDWPFLGARDVLGLLGRDTPVSTAVHNSARFPYLSPAGNLKPPAPDLEPAAMSFGERPAQIADGGYFENSGVTTAFELVQWLQARGCSLIGNACGQRTILPILVVIDADAEPDVRGPQVPRCGSGPSGDPRRTLDVRAAPQLLAPLDTLYSVRSGHGAYAIEKARELLCNSHSGSAGDHDGKGHAFFDFYLHAGRDGGVPLNWVLSRRVEHRIWIDLTDAYDNARELQHLKDTLQPPPPADLSPDTKAPGGAYARVAGAVPPAVNAQTGN